MILVIQINDDDADHWASGIPSGEWDRIEGESAGELGSLVQIRHISRNRTISAQNGGRVVGYGKVLGFRHSNKANQPMCRFYRDARERSRR